MSIDSTLGNDFVANVSDLPQQYLDLQGKQFGATFDVLIICSLVFHQNRVLLIRMNEEVKAWKDKVGAPLYRLYQKSDKNEVSVMLRSRVDREMEDDVSVEEFARVACRTQVGLDPGMLRVNRAAAALHTAVSPQVIENSIWLRASLLWTIETPMELKPDQYVCQELFWANEEEVSSLPTDTFFMRIKEDIETAFRLQQGAQSGHNLEPTQ